MMEAIRLIIFLALILSLASCNTEERNFAVEPHEADTNPPINISMSELHAGGISAELPPIKNKYEENAYALSEGKRLFETFNCAGCHAHGGGGMGPALMDDQWIYGSDPGQVHATIVEGRPNGMPSFRGRIPDYEIWQLAAYVRSMGGLTSKSAVTGREDHMKGKPPENSLPPQQPRNSSPSPSKGAQ
jgi:cytochrome c oxidase cbb3-type subunit 3